MHREAPVIDVNSRRAAEESAWRIKSVKLERDRHAQQRHLNPLNMADTIGHLVNSFKGRHRDAILVIGEVLIFCSCLQLIGTFGKQFEHDKCTCCSS